MQMDSITAQNEAQIETQKGQKTHMVLFTVMLVVLKTTVYEVLLDYDAETRYRDIFFYS